MFKFIKSFLIFIVLYHILVTIVCYGIFGWQYQEIFSIIRDGIWIVWLFVIIISYRKVLGSYLRVRKYPLIWFWILLLFGVGMSLFHQKSLFDIFVGIKYGFWYLMILFGSSLILFILAKYKKPAELAGKSDSLTKFLRAFVYWLVIVVILWFLWQFAKLILPEFFAWIGYWPLDNFRFGDKPPLYYLTGYEWTLRWQWIFSWPNNYWYFLIAFLPIIIQFFKLKRTSFKKFLKDKTALINTGIIILWFAAIALTLSRSAIIGTLVVLAFISRSWIKKHRKIALWIFVLSIWWLIWLSVLKETSTLAHITAKISSLASVIDQPLGYWLGSSWPAVHHNWNILPENYFIQIIIDIGTVWFLIWIFCISQVAMIGKMMRRPPKSPSDGDFIIYSFWKGLTIGWIALLVMWMFLHVFEDSMVNYIFFILWWITTGHLSYWLKWIKWWVFDFWKIKLRLKK